MSREQRIQDFKRLLTERILVLDGAMGTMIQAYAPDEAAYRGQRFHDWPSDLKGNNDLLTLTQPAMIREIHGKYLEAGADIIETNTFNSSAPAAGRLPHGRHRGGAQSHGGAPGARGGRPVRRAHRPAALRGRGDRSHQSHRVAIAATSTIRAFATSISISWWRPTARRRGADRRRRRPDPAGDHLRYAQCQGGAVRRAPHDARAVGGTADHDLGHHHRCLGAHALGPDRRGVLERGPPCEPTVVGLNCALGAKQLRPYVEDLSRIADVASAPIRTPDCRTRSASTTSRPARPRR